MHESPISDLEDVRFNPIGEVHQAHVFPLTAAMEFDPTVRENLARAEKQACEELRKVTEHYRKFPIQQADL